MNKRYYATNNYTYLVKGTIYSYSRLRIVVVS